MTLHLIVDLVNTDTDTDTDALAESRSRGGGGATAPSTPAWAPYLTLISANAGSRVAGLAAVRK